MNNVNDGELQRKIHENEWMWMQQSKREKIHKQDKEIHRLCIMYVRVRNSGADIIQIAVKVVLM